MTLAAAGADVGGCGLAFFIQDVADHDRRAFGGKHPGLGRAHAAGTAAD